jgi:prolyl oligopeptidase
VAPGKVVINGASNGGLLVAACLNRAPEGTFGAAVAEVGVHDMLKVCSYSYLWVVLTFSNQFADFTIGKLWTADYGDPHVPEDFDFIYPISPLHNIPDQEFPPTILLTADRKFSHS